MLRLLEHNIGNRSLVSMSVIHDRLNGTPVVCTVSCNTRYIYRYAYPARQPFDTNKFRSLKKKQEKGTLNTNAHTYKHMHTAVSNIQAEHTHTAPLILPTSSYTILLHHSIFIYLFLTLFLEYWTFHPPSIPQKPSPFSPIPPIFFGGVPFKLSISQLKFRLPPTIHTCS